MPSTESRSSGTSARGCMLKVCWQCVYVLYPLLFLLSLPEHTHTAKPRCGWELVADLEFVCGSRGFYRGRSGGPRGIARQRGKGIVEECCEKGCDLQHLEMYCAKPKRTRRHAADTAQQTMELMFRALLLRRYEQQASHAADRHAERMRFLKSRSDLHGPTKKQPPLPELAQDDASLHHNGSLATETTSGQQRHTLPPQPPAH